MKGIISFYEKPGCQGNAAQKKMLREAGYMLEERDILTTKWDVEKLLNFFNCQSPQLYINDRAPIITSGELDPSQLSDEQLILAMIEHPILIKRPLIFFRGEFCCGFDTDLVAKLLGHDQTDVGCQCHPEEGA